MLPSESTTGGVAAAQCRAWLQWAAAQIDACVASDALATNELLASLANLLGSARAAALTPHDPANAQLSAVIMAVQAHDRVMQGLVHVKESLRALQAQLGDARHADSADSWRALREKQYRAFSMPEERLLFARMVAHEDEDEAWRKAGRIPVEAVAVELFTTDDGPFES
jgi:hypothetical protein